MESGLFGGHGEHFPPHDDYTQFSHVHGHTRVRTHTYTCVDAITLKQKNMQPKLKFLFSVYDVTPKGRQ